jgi:two-component system, chemotaxis family, sensor kinase CheA
MERELLQQIWPIFSAEAREHLQGISSSILELERDPFGSGLLDGIRRTAHSLKGSAASLGISDVEHLAHAIESSLAGFDPAVGLGPEGVQAALDAVEAIEEALATGDAGGEPRISALDALLAALRTGGPVSDGPAPAPRAEPAAVARGKTGRGSGNAQLDVLEDRLEQLCAPVSPGDRARLAGEGAVAARVLAARAPAGAGEVGRLVA